MAKQDVITGDYNTPQPWTPLLRGSTTTGVTPLATNNSTWTKIAGVVTLHISCVFDPDDSSWVDPNGSYYVEGLPYDFTYGCGPVPVFMRTAGTTAFYLAQTATTGTARLYLYKFDSTFNSLNGAELPKPFETGDSLRCTYSYVPAGGYLL